MIYKNQKLVNNLIYKIQNIQKKNQMIYKKLILIYIYIYIYIYFKCYFHSSSSSDTDKNYY